jgi:hypothetical protein
MAWWKRKPKEGNGGIPVSDDFRNFEREHPDDRRAPEIGGRFVPITRDEVLGNRSQGEDQTYGED